MSTGRAAWYEVAAPAWLLESWPPRVRFEIGYDVLTDAWGVALRWSRCAPMEWKRGTFLYRRGLGVWRGRDGCWWLDRTPRDV